MDNSSNYDIDFVVTWVNGNDPAWKAEKKLCSPDKNTDARDERYRDMDIMQYWFRAVEKHAPWVRRIHFITWGHLPSWLNIDNPKLHIVNHKDYMPEGSLPTFNSNALELNMHRIDDLADHFVYFNDDMLLNSDCSAKDFFKNGLPRDLLAFQPVVSNPHNPVMSHLLQNDSLVICKHFKKRENVRKHPGAYFHLGYPPLYFFYNMLELMFPLYTGFYNVHGPAALLKSTFTELWKLESDTLSATSNHKFRSSEDVTIYLLRDWQKLTGHFVPTNIQKKLAYFNLATNNDQLLKTITAQKKMVICLNDSSMDYDFEKAAEEIRRVFQNTYPEKSSFEK